MILFDMALKSVHIHNPVQQVFLDRSHPMAIYHLDPLQYCPRCQIYKGTGHDYGDIDIPPISVQYSDKRNRRTRNWNARRCYCEQCNHLWDVVIEWDRE